VGARKLQEYEGVLGFEGGYAGGKLEDGIGRVLQFVKTLCLNAWHGRTYAI
jgi:hypothetical protein